MENKGIINSLSAPLRDEKGVTAVEFAVVAPILALILVAVIEIGLAIMTYFTVQEAVLAGANYASHNGWNELAIRNAVSTSAQQASLPVTAVTASQHCGCPSGTAIVVQTCSTICAGDSIVARQYVVVSASVARPHIVGQTFGLPANVTVSMTTKLP